MNKAVVRPKDFRMFAFQYQEDEHDEFVRLMADFNVTVKRGERSIELYTGSSIFSKNGGEWKYIQYVDSGDWVIVERPGQIVVCPEDEIETEYEIVERF